MSQGQRPIPNWLRRMRSWQEAPDWLLALIQKERGGFSFVDLGTTPEEAGFAPADELTAGDATELPATLEWERMQPPTGQGDEIVPEAGPPEPEQGVGAGPVPPLKQSEVTDWLVGLEGEASAEAGPSPPGEMRERSDWAAEWQELAKETHERDVEGLPEPGEVEGEPPARRSGITDWLTHLEEGPPEQAAPGPGPAAAMPDLPAEDEDRAARSEQGDMPDWMAGLQAAAPEGGTAEGEDAGQPPAWLTDLESEATLEEEDLLADRERGTPAWLRELEGDEAEEDIPAWLAELDSGGGIAGWLAEQEESEADAGGEGEAFPPPADERGAGAAPTPGEEAPQEAVEQPPSAPFTEPPEASLEAAGLQEDELPDWLRDLGEAADDQPSGPEPEAEMADWLADQEPRAQEPAAHPEDIAAEGEAPAWLRDLGEATDDQPSGPEQEADIADWLTDQEPRAQEPAVHPEDIAAEPAEDEVPAWLRDLDEVIDDRRQIADQEAGIAEEAEQVEPTPVEPMPVELTQGPGELEDSDVGESVSEEDTPDWLLDLAIDEGEPEPGPPSDAGAPMPDWFSFEETSSASDATPATESQGEEEPGEPAPGAPAWMEDIYAPQEEAPTGEETLSLPPAEAWTDEEMPDWLSSLRDEGTAPARHGPPVETSGPLAGLGGVLSPEPILANFPKSAFQPMPPVPDAHQAEAELVEHALETPASRRIRVSRSPGREILNSLGRWVIHGLLLAAVLIAPLRSCVRLPDFAETRTFYNAIEGLRSGNAVLVVFDYDASLDGTLTPQARAIIWHLQRKDLSIVLLSLTPQGVAIAEDLIDEREGLVAGRDYVDLGYLPPHPASLLAFMSNPLGGAARFGATEDPAETVLGRQVRTFSDLDMIVTITGDHEHVRWWIEQVRSRAQIDLLAAVPAAIAPYVEPYYSELGTGQVAGILGGLAPTAQYEELIEANFLPSARLSYVVQTNALLLFTCVVLVSGLGSLLGPWSRRGAPVKSRGSTGGVE
jgi:hypothetical protein